MKLVEIFKRLCNRKAFPLFILENKGEGDKRKRFLRKYCQSVRFETIFQTQCCEKVEKLIINDHSDLYSVSSIFTEK